MRFNSETKKKRKGIQNRDLDKGWVFMKGKSLNREIKFDIFWEGSNNSVTRYNEDL